ETINQTPNGAVWKSRDAFDAWCKEVAALAPEAQEKAVAAELKERNPGFDGVVTSAIDKGVLTSLQFQADKVVDLAPVRALAGLKSLSCAGSGKGRGLLADLWPLKGMSLVSLNLDHTRVINLNPLRG